MERELVVRGPGPPVRRYVERYWGYAVRTPGPVRQREPLPTAITLIFGLGPEVRLVGPARPPTRLGSFVAGLDDACAVIEHDGEMSGVQVDLTPLAARMIFRLSMHELAREVVALEDVFGTGAALLEERLVEARSWGERVELVEKTLSARLEDAEPPPPDVDWAWRRLKSAAGQLRVAELAAELGCSRDHLAARFREHVGLPPKLVARMFRFRNTVDLMDAQPEQSIAELAFAGGYYDQSHLDRDFQDFAGTTPTEYFAASEPVTFVQDTAAASS